MDYDAKLRELVQAQARKQKLEAVAQQQQRRLWELDQKRFQLKQQLNKEQADVTILEGWSLTALYYGLLGRKAEQLQKEQEEAYRAKVLYDAACREYDALNQELRATWEALSHLEDCPREYARLLEEKKAAIHARGGAPMEALLRLESQEAWMDAQLRELQEAIDAGLAARSLAGRIAQSLSSAQGWATWDLLGGGLVSDLAKYSHLDEAQRQLSELQTRLRKFQTELADVTLSADFSVEIDGGLRLADYFLDSLFTDWMVMDQITNSQSQVQRLAAQIDVLLEQLRKSRAAVAEDRERLLDKIHRQVAEAKL